MPKRDAPTVNVKFDQEDLAKVRAKAEAAGESVTSFVRRMALEAVGSGGRPSAPREAPSAPKPENHLGCPRGCDPAWRPASSLAKCPHCGRRAEWI